MKVRDSSGKQDMKLPQARQAAVMKKRNGREELLFYLALHISLFGQVVQLIMIIFVYCH